MFLVILISILIGQILPLLCPAGMTGESRVVLKKYIFIDKCNKSAYKIEIIIYLCLITKGAKR
jgi:hypothetical protein